MYNDPQISVFLNWLNNYIERQIDSGHTPAYNDLSIIEELSKIKNVYSKNFLIEKHLCKKFKDVDKESIILLYSMDN